MIEDGDFMLFSNTPLRQGTSELGFLYRITKSREPTHKQIDLVSSNFAASGDTPVGV